MAKSQVGCQGRTAALAEVAPLTLHSHHRRQTVHRHTFSG